MLLFPQEFEQPGCQGCLVGKVPQRNRRKGPSKKVPKKNIDDIKRIREVLELFDLLGIKEDSEELNLSEMKKIAKWVIEDQSSGSGKYLNGPTVTLYKLLDTIVYMPDTNATFSDKRFSRIIISLLVHHLYFNFTSLDCFLTALYGALISVL